MKQNIRSTAHSDIVEFFEGISIQGVDVPSLEIDPKIKKIRMQQWKKMMTFPLILPKIKRDPKPDIEQLIFAWKIEKTQYKRFDAVDISKFDQEYSGVILLQSGICSTWIEPGYARKGVILCDLKTAEVKHADLLEMVLHTFKADNKIILLAQAAATNGLFLFIPNGINIEKPILFHNLIDKESRLAIQNNVIIAGGNSSVSVVKKTESEVRKEKSLSLESLGFKQSEGSSIKLQELQMLDSNMINIGTEKVHLEKDAQAEWISSQIGSMETHLNMDLELSGEGSHADVNGLYIPSQSQKFDIRTRQDHLAPGTSSNLHFKGVVLDKTRSIWSGMINVSRNAQKSTSLQTNNNLIMDETAHIDSIPGMEILANNVQCKHGATIGKIDPAQVFYLESRGIEKTEAEQLLVEAFLDPISQKYALPGFRYTIKKSIQQKLLKHKENLVHSRTLAGN